MTTPATLYVGRRKDMIRECAAFDTVCKFILMPEGNGSFAQDGCDTLKECKAQIAFYREAYPEISVEWV
jgi:hypothetical protein